MEEQLSRLGVGGSQAVASALNTSAEDYTNNALIEHAWAMKAVKYAETHMKILQSRDAKDLKLTKYDDDMYKKFQEQFNDLEVNVLNPDDIKSESAKAVWRTFCNFYEHLIEDFNFATLLRIDSSKDYSEENTIIVPRVQFLTIEVVRNKSGFNSIHHKLI